MSIPPPSSGRWPPRPNRTGTTSAPARRRPVGAPRLGGHPARHRSRPAAEQRRSAGAADAVREVGLSYDQPAPDSGRRPAAQRDRRARPPGTPDRAGRPRRLSRNRPVDQRRAPDEDMIEPGIFKANDIRGSPPATTRSGTPTARTSWAQPSSTRSTSPTPRVRWCWAATCGPPVPSCRGLRRRVPEPWRRRDRHRPGQHRRAVVRLRPAPAARA